MCVGRPWIDWIELDVPICSSSSVLASMTGIKSLIHSAQRWFDLKAITKG